jgi:predicted nucleotidyltransferase
LQVAQQTKTSTPTPTAKANVTEALAAKYEGDNYTVTLLENVHDVYIKFWADVVLR